MNQGNDVIKSLNERNRAIEQDRDFWKREAIKAQAELGERKIAEVMPEINIRVIADYYGYGSQSRQLIEEMAELMVAINKDYRVSIGATDIQPLEALNNIAGEVADVTIMLEQIKYLLLGSYDIDKIIQDKLQRQMNRIKGVIGIE